MAINAIIYKKKFSFYFSETKSLVIRPEEVSIILLILVLWVVAIMLFFNRWGKIRQLEPYQPQFEKQKPNLPDQHQPNCPLVNKRVPLSKIQRGISLPATGPSLVYTKGIQITYTYFKDHIRF